ncbi:MAG: hypothetical protein ACWGHP_10510 [Stenotrophomonas sp.]
MSTTTWPTSPPADGEDAKPTAGFQRVIQRAVIHVQSSGREEVTGANVLVAIFSERESHAAYFLQEQDMTRYDAVNYISHGIAKRPGATETAPATRRRRASRGRRRGNDVKTGQGRERSRPIASTSTRRPTSGKIDPLIGRQAEINRTIQVLCRRTKNNPLLRRRSRRRQDRHRRGPRPQGSSTATCPRC